MRPNFKIHPIARSIATFGAVAALVTGVTFANLNNTATLTENNINSATANLQVDSQGDNSFADTDPGFTFVGVVPGGSAVPSTGFAFKLKNNGGVNDAALDIKVTLGSLPSWSTSVDNNQVHLRITCDGDITGTLDATLYHLYWFGDSLGSAPLDVVGHVSNCTAQVYMDLGAFSGSGAMTTPSFNIVFTGNAHI